ncbi:hypothetical protein ASF79_12975 [Agreia sp. Leaf335]|uniref:sigma-70 family RNA polymerase sigma factor n=1 Tax=Agreia sp. Leaf335 TaxID=1736340 RepID=UPI000715833F|nr:sigma-70 family RNA polymerase sigma factor [Agreia sp. Leaf335]KQR20420.1 hypothetical protein ASF79_12975 [Agreia sp. Leaf335]
MEDETRAMQHLFAQREKLINTLRYHAGGLDPEDLLSDAVLRLFERLRAGDTLPDHLEAYLIRAAKNAVIDYYRSPRSREELQDPAAPEFTGRLIHSDEDFHHHIETSPERKLLRNAFINLTEIQQRVLIETTIYKRPPRDLVGEFDMTPQNIANTAHRARRALGNEVLRLLLIRGTFECQRYARRISGRPPVLPIKAVAHLNACAICRQHINYFHSLLNETRRVE